MAFFPCVYASHPTSRRVNGNIRFWACLLDCDRGTDIPLDSHQEVSPSHLRFLPLLSIADPY